MEKIRFLYNEKIVDNIQQIKKIEKKGEIVGDYNLQNKIEATINDIKNIDIEYGIDIIFKYYRK